MTRSRVSSMPPARRLLARAATGLTVLLGITPSRAGAQQHPAARVELRDSFPDSLPMRSAAAGLPDSSRYYKNDCKTVRAMFQDSIGSLMAKNNSNAVPLSAMGDASLFEAFVECNGAGVHVSRTPHARPSPPSPAKADSGAGRADTAAADATRKPSR